MSVWLRDMDRMRERASGSGRVRDCVCVRVCATLKLQALIYDILHSTTAVFSYAIGSRKLSANEQFFVGAQTVVSLLQTTQIKQGVSFIVANKVYTSTNKTTIVWIDPGPKKRKEFRLDSNDCGFIYAGVNFVGGYKWHAFFKFELFVTNLQLFEHQQKTHR